MTLPNIVVRRRLYTLNLAHEARHTYAALQASDRTKLQPCYTSTAVAAITRAGHTRGQSDATSHRNGDLAGAERLRDCAAATYSILNTSCGRHTTWVARQSRWLFLSRSVGH